MAFNKYVDNSSVKLCAQLNSLKTTKKISGHVDMFNRDLAVGDVVFYVNKFGVITELMRMSCNVAFDGYGDWINSTRLIKVNDQFAESVTARR